MTFANKQFTNGDIEKYIEPLLSQASSDCWGTGCGYVYGWKGNPIIAAILMYKERNAKKAQRIAELERDLAFYKERYLEAAANAKQLIGAK